ncbi:MAG: hypothetical protein U1G08_12180 [Verrucomicrobiota bacterium]
MKRTRGIPGVEGAVTAFAAWQSSDLIAAWRHAPLDRWGWLALLIWVAPLPWAARSAMNGRVLWPFGLALGVTLAGTLGSLNAACYAGLAIALAAWAGTDPISGRWIWWTASVSWMPLLGWVGKDLGGTTLTVFRFLLAGAGVASLLLFGKSRRSPPNP